MRETDIAEQLGLMLEPERNKLPLSTDMKEDMFIIHYAIQEMSTQKMVMGIFHQDVWLDFLPWHSLN